ncbi:MAG: YetF domain-containing protein [Rhodovibrionaceae bacterium]
MFFDGWQDLLRIGVVGTLAYAGLVLFLRVSGKRTLSKMNAFDFVVTVALGSTLATALLSKDVSLSEGLAAFALLCALQYLVAIASVHSKAFQRLVKSEPSLLYFQGDYLQAMLRRERITEEEVVAAVRAAGYARLDAVEAVVLETDGAFSVLPARQGESADTLRNVKRDSSAR